VPTNPRERRYRSMAFSCWEEGSGHGYDRFIDLLLEHLKVVKPELGICRFVALCRYLDLQQYPNVGLPHGDVQPIYPYWPIWDSMVT